ncbi:hypothetical protein LRY65_00710 [Candidatus Woesebacteria bacterium]|nr:hypothetical protein [Candidatus Woesebacteria bacterium]MCD8507204.1 hypothetical protein [Candidatus Woesebacteria bacterium]MCD8526720.1 hypothetical protein [Candidatus Woesebacteria bacterium]MCD8546537.1 hypothetical protein [Candidatus Woesebacteria bacterium]
MSEKGFSLKDYMTGFGPKGEEPEEIPVSDEDRLWQEQVDHALSTYKALARGYDAPLKHMPVDSINAVIADVGQTTFAEFYAAYKKITLGESQPVDAMRDLKEKIGDEEFDKLMKSFDAVQAKVSSQPRYSEKII